MLLTGKQQKACPQREPVSACVSSVCTCGELDMQISQENLGFFFLEEKISLSCQLSDASKRQIAHDVMWGTDLMVSWLWKAQQQCVSTHMQCVCMSACAHLSHLAGLGELADMSWICCHAFGSSSCQEPQRLPPPAPLIVGFFSTTIPGEMDFNVLFREFKHLLIASRLQV